MVLAAKGILCGLILTVGLAACGHSSGSSPSASGRATNADDSSGFSSWGTSAGPSHGATDGSSVGTSGRAPGGTPTAARPGGTGGKTSTSTGWTVTVYYTAVAHFHPGRIVKVTGCSTLDCSKGHSDLGSYPSDFVQAVKDEGAGKIADGKYLNWSYDTGYWLDTAARDSAGRALRPFETAAADPNVMSAGTTFTIVQCGRDEQGQAVDAAVCARLSQARWTIADEFTPGFGGAHHLDVYIGEETGPNFTNSPWYTTLTGASLAIS